MKTIPLFATFTAIVLAGCGRSDSSTPKAVTPQQVTHATNTAGSTATKDQALTPPATLPAKPTSALTTMQEDAIALNLAVQSSRGIQPRGFALSPDLVSRLEKYNPSPKADGQSKNVNWSSDDDGSVFYSFDEKSVWTITFRGSITAKIRYIKGKVGIKKGEVFIDDGTRVEVDGKEYIFQNGIWGNSQ